VNDSEGKPARARPVTASTARTLPFRAPRYGELDVPEALDSKVSLDAEELTEDRFSDRYSAGSLLGEGGMGEVRLARDRRVGRDVALKAIRAAHGGRGDLRERFVREARIQGQLEHPAIVPVYDLGVSADGAAYFTMKRVRGQTLEEVIDLLVRGDLEARAAYSRRRLLTAFRSVCLAVDFAHARGVIHRDLKPGNIMLGDFGEVYVLDWGVAKVGDAADPDDARWIDAPVSSGATEAGAVVGTPGYMAPEQLLGGAIDARADVYALGSILFELLTLEPLHPTEPPERVVSSSLNGADARCSARAPAADVPPELEAICVRATATLPDGRFASARDVNEAIERFLDGDRDVAQRRAMAARHVDAARTSVDRALSDADDADRHRGTAMRELGRAIALDPDNGDAAQAMMALMTKAPSRLPLEAWREIERGRQHTRRVMARAAAVAYLSWFLYAPSLLVMGFRDMTLAVWASLFMGAAAILSFEASRRARRQLLLSFVAMSAASVAIAISTRVFGPFIITPIAALVNVVAVAMNNERRHRVLAGAIGMASFLVPAALEWCGVLAPSYDFVDGRLVVLPHLVSFDRPAAVLVFLLLASVGVTLTALAYVGWLRDSMSMLERRAQLRAWQFRQLAPDTATHLAFQPAESVHLPLRRREQR